MDEPLESWPRPLYRDGGGQPFVFYKLHGDFSTMPRVSRAVHRCAGVPVGLELFVTTREVDPAFFEFGLTGVFAKDLEPALADALAAAPHALIIRGEVRDAATLDYLRDVIGMCTAMLDGGALAVFDPQILTWWTPARWREQVFAPGEPAIGRHAMILVSEEPDDPHRAWVHTRGLRLFGRPDLSIHRVPTELMPVMKELCDRFIAMAAAGAVIGDGQPIRMEALPGDWRCFHAGSFDDPDFNNVHLDIRRLDES
ncbi:MAG TPA: hypothetical protein VM734_11700 [Kofleriaceae bacterium]|nr:hypothetical protein [Kofleriaceae bacterium]